MKKLKKKTISLFLFIALMVGMGLSSYSAAADNVRDSPEEFLGHKFDEEYWAIVYDVLDRETVQDFTPGPYSDEYQEPNFDFFPNLQAEFYSVYVDIGAVETVFMSLMNYSRDTTYRNNTATAPYQVLLQHFKAPGGNHVLVQNSFAGLLAYQENGTEVNGVPNRDDALYYGYTLNSEYHKHLINQFLTTEIGKSPFDEDLVPKITPINISKTEVNGEVTYEFGIEYENLFVVWQSIGQREDLNETSNAEVLFDKVKGISQLDSLNFTYTLSGKMVEDQAVNITTQTEYRIGNTSDLWIINDNKDYTENIGGHFFDLSTNFNLSRYNQSLIIEDRLDGDESAGVNGFSLAVSNFARMVVLSTEISQEDVDVKDEQGNNVDGDQASKNVTSLGLEALDNDAFLIDFKSKENYTLNGGDPMLAPVRLYPNAKVRNPTLHKLDSLAMRFITKNIKRVVNARVENAAERLNLDEQNINVDTLKRNAFYCICFPKWAGGEIVQDPTFVAYAEPVSSDGGDIGSRIDSFSVLAITMSSALGIFVSLKIVKRKKSNSNRLI